MQLHPVYKKLMLIAMVLGPFYWLVISDDGQRRTDLVLLRLMGDPAFNLALDKLTPRATEADIRSQFPDLDLRCQDRPGPFGDRTCAGAISAFNDVPAHFVSLYLNEGRVRAVKIAYRGPYHQYLLEGLHRTLGQPQPPSDGPKAPADDQEVLSWTLPEGMVVVPKNRIERQDEPALFWLSEHTAREAPFALRAP